MAPTDQLTLQCGHHFVEIGLWWEAESNLDSEVSDALAFALGNPFETDFLSPTPGSLSPSRLDGRGFIPVDPGSRCLVEGFQHSLGLVHVRLFALKIQSCIIGKRLVPDSAPPSRVRPSIAYLGSSIICPRTLVAIMKR